jgi:hypothetical protein
MTEPVTGREFTREEVGLALRNYGMVYTVAELEKIPSATPVGLAGPGSPCGSGE